MHQVLEAAVRRISREVDALDIDTAQSHPNESSQRWSSQQVIEHLVLTYRVTASCLEERLEKGRIARNAERSFVQRILQLMILSFGHFPEGVPALSDTVPKAGVFRPMDGEDLVNLLTRELDAMDAVLDRCRQRFGMERVAIHPLLGPLRVDQWRRFHAVHSLHHVKQLRRLREHFAQSVIAGKAVNVKLAKELQIPVQRTLT